jgi:hypothetical protein
MAGQLRQLSGPEEHDTVDSQSSRTRWACFGFTRAQLATIAGIAIVDENTPRTAYLAKWALVVTAPDYIGQAPLVSVKTVEADELDNVYEFELEYAAGAGAPPPGYGTTPVGGPVSGPSIRIATQTVNVQVPDGELRFYYRDDTVVLQNEVKGILPDGQGNYRGADVMVPMISWSEPHVVAGGDFSLAKGKALVGKYNSGTFRGFPAGTVLCTGASADRRPTGEWDVALEFQHLDNLAGKAPGFDNFEDVDKKGWEFMFPVVENGEIKALAVAPLYKSVSFSTIVPSLADA